jgi:putative endonuclease
MLVAQWYEVRGWSVVARNFRSKRGELDVVAMADGILAVCEVKSRSSTAMGHPFESITAVKQLRVRRAGADFVAHLRRTDAALFASIRRVRFDAASVVGDDVDVLFDAF